MAENQGEGRRQKTEDRRQKTEDRRQKTEDRRQKTGGRRQKTGDRERRAECGMRRWGAINYQLPTLEPPLPSLPTAGPACGVAICGGSSCRCNGRSFRRLGPPL